MDAKYVQQGLAIDYIPETDINAGDVVILGDLTGIAKLDIKAGERGALALVGVFDVPKTTGEGTALVTGGIVFWDTENKVVTVTGGENKYLGKVIADAGDDDATVRVIINVSRDVPLSAIAAIADPEADAEDIDDQTGGAASETHQLAAVADTSAADQSGTINNNFATLAAGHNLLKDDVEANNAKLDEILAGLRTLGLVEVAAE